MGQATDGQLPSDPLGYRAEGVYTPGVGTVAQQGGTVSTDANGTNYAPTVVTTAAGSTTAITGSGIAASLPAIVQKAHAVSTSGVASQTCAFASNVTAGNTIVVLAGVGNNGAITVTDSLSNTYTQAIKAANSTTFESGIFFSPNIAGGACTVTVTPSASVSVGVQIYEVSGLLAQVTAQPDQSSSGTGTGTTATTSNLSSAPNSLAFQAVSVGTAAQAVSVTTGSNWTLDSTANVGGTPSGIFTFGALSQFQGPQTPTLAVTATIAGSEPWADVAAIFKPVSLPVAGTVTIGGYNYTRVTTAATTLVKTGPGVLHAIVVNKPTSTATIEADDALTNTTPIIGILGAFAASIAPFTVVYDVAFTTGLSVTVGVATVDATIVWR